jgi:flagellar biosynthesis protein FliQ
MTETDAVALGQNTLFVVLLVSSPVLVTALIVGTTVSVLQTVTQVQEVTLVYVPKILAVFLVIAAFGSFMLGRATDFGEQMFRSIAEESR